jgi:hypothetical protein
MRGGVGNSLGITQTISANIGKEDRVEWRGNVLVDLNRNEAILKRERLNSLPRVDGVRVYRSRLGSVDGLEFSANERASNRWVLCDSKPGARPAGCVLITPMTRTNMKLLSVMGALRKNR